MTELEQAIELLKKLSVEEKNELLELRMDLIRKVSKMSEQDLMDLNFALELVKQTNMLNEIEVAKANKDFYERMPQTPVSNSKS